MTQQTEHIHIHLYHKLPTPYNDMLFRSLHNDGRVNLDVYHLWRSRDNRPWTVELATGYRNHYLNTKIFGIDFSLLNRAIKDRESFFIVGDWAHASSIIILIARILLGAPVAIWTDTPQQERKRTWSKKQLRQVFLDWLLPRVDIIFGTGKPALTVLKEMGLPEKKLINLPCFVDLELPKRVQYDESIMAKARNYRDQVGCTASDIVFLIAGTCVHYKGQDVTLKAFAKATQSLKRNIGLLVAGDGPERELYEDLATNMGIIDQVAFLGWLDPEDMDAAYAACDVVVNSSRRDAYPLVILEGMSCGKVVIGTDICGSIEDRVIDGQNGFSFQSENHEQLVNIFIEIVNNEDLRQKVGVAARKTSELWPVDRGVDTIIQTAQRVIESKKK